MLISVFNIMILISFIYCYVQKSKNRPLISVIIISILISRLIGIVIFLYILNVNVSHRLVKIRFFCDDLTYIFAIILIIYVKIWCEGGKK